VSATEAVTEAVTDTGLEESSDDPGPAESDSGPGKKVNLGM